MSKKKLLEENTVSKFMKLANIDSSRSKRFLTEMYGYEEEEGMHGMGHAEKEEGSYGMDEMGGYGKDPMDIDELDLDKYMNEAEEEEEKKGAEEDEMGELSMTSEEAKDVVSALEKLLSKLKSAVGSEPESEEAPEGEEEMAPEMEEPAPEGEEAPAGEEETPAALQEALVNKVARRVAARLLRESKAKAAVKKPVKPKK